MIGGEENLAQKRLAVAVGNAGVEIARLVGHQSGEGTEVCAEGGDALVPRGPGRRRRGRRPVAVWKRR